jgi:hypothetical protein
VNQPTAEHAAHAIATTLAAAAHVVDAYWTEAEADDDARRITRLTANLLNALVDGNPPAADDSLHAIDDLFAKFPNGDTTPGAC